MKHDSFEITYRFILPDDTVAEFKLEIDERSIELVNLESELPDWTALSHQQCVNCPLSVESHPRCPAAVAIFPLLDRFSDLISYETVEVEVETEARTVSRETTAQQGIASLMGVTLAVSGCPHTAYFKPMARYHLPFAAHDETFYRAASMYLLGQHFAVAQGRSADMSLQGLMDIYSRLQVVNRSMAQRIVEQIKQDASVNALVLLDVFAMMLPEKISHSMHEIEHLFSAYLDS